MASNAKWCKPLSALARTLRPAACMAEDAQALHDMNVLFDFRCAYGEASFAAALREHLRGLVAAGQHAFFFHLAQTTLQFKPPLGFFGNIQLESGGEHRSAFNIKNAIIPVVNFARIYALSHHLEETNTLDRLRPAARPWSAAAVQPRRAEPGVHAAHGAATGPPGAARVRRRRTRQLHRARPS